MRELLSQCIIANDTDIDFYILCELYGDGCFSIAYKVCGKYCRQEFRLKDISLFDEFFDHLKSAFDDAGDFSKSSFNTVDCFIDAQIDKLYDKYCAYEALSW